MTKGTPADPLRDAIDGYKAGLAGEPMGIVSEEYDRGWCRGMSERAALATKPAEQPAVNMESLNKFLGRDHPTESAGKSPEATDGRRWPATDLGATDEDALAIHRAMKGRP